MRRLNSPQHNTYLSVGILNADIHSNHEENGNGDTEISNQTTELVRQRANDAQGSKPQNPLNGFLILSLFKSTHSEENFDLTGPGK